LSDDRAGDCRPILRTPVFLNALSIDVDKLPESARPGVLRRALAHLPAGRATVFDYTRRGGPLKWRGLARGFRRLQVRSYAGNGEGFRKFRTQLARLLVALLPVFLKCSGIKFKTPWWEMARTSGNAGRTVRCSRFAKGPTPPKSRFGVEFVQWNADRPSCRLQGARATGSA